MTERMTKHELYMNMARLIAERSTCTRRHVGAVLVKDNVVLTTGYNGAPRRLEHCDKTGCLRTALNVPSGERHELCRGVHAEQNCIIFAGRQDVSVVGATLYSTTFPCIICAKMLINAGIKIVIYEGDYGPSERLTVMDMFNMANVHVYRYLSASKTVEQIEW